MRGVVFTELIEFVEEALGFDVADAMIEKAHLQNNGAFTQGGNYPFEELQKIVISLSEITGKPISDLLELFGRHLFKRLVGIYNRDIRSIGNSLDFIDSVEKFVHVEVKKLYPDADLPTFTTEEKTDHAMSMVYSSEKRLEAFAKGLLEGCAEYFDENLDITYETISESPYRVRFHITKS